jgi:hypothetical protein
MLVILAMQEAQIGGWQSEVGLGQKYETLSGK